MRSEFAWFCKRHFRSFAHQFKTDWQFRAAAIVLLIEVAALAYFAANSFLLSRLI